MLAELINEKFEYEFSNLWCGLLGEIESYSKSTSTAEVHPLVKIKTQDGFIRLPIIKCPVNLQLANGIALIHDLKKGDIVDLKGNIYPIDNQIKGQVESASSMKFLLSNCTVIGAHLTKPTVINPSVLKDGLVIADISGSMYAQFSSSQIEFKIGNSETQKTLLGEDSRDLIEEILDMILELIVMTPTGPSSPVSAMPANVTKIETIRAKLDGLLSSKVKHN
jgi:hypothetical protein